jgi:tetratricopeptide (TPR) repeat protein
MLCLVAWPAPVQSQSAAFTDAFNRYSELYDQGRYQEALPFAEQALKLGEQEFGPDHPHTASFLINLAELYQAQGRYAEAEPLYKRALAIREKALGPEHPQVAENLNNLADLYRVQGKYAEAEPLQKRALAIREKPFGLERPDVAASKRRATQEQNSEEREREVEDIFAQLETNPGDPQLHKRALALLEAELRAKPGEPVVLDFRCMYRAMWQTSHAIPNCTEAVSAKRDPNDEISGTPSVALQYRGFAYLCLGEPQKALQDFDAWSKQPLPQWAALLGGLEGNANPLPWYFRGVANRLLGNERQAELDFEVANQRSRYESVPIERSFMTESGAVVGPQCMVDLLREMHLMR